MRKRWKDITMVCGIIFMVLGASLASAVDSMNDPITVVHDNQKGTLSISGTVRGLPLNGSGRVPVEGAQVMIVGGKLSGGFTFAFQKSAPTDSQGYYSFSDIPRGIFCVFALKPGAYLPGLRLVRLTIARPFKFNLDINMIRLGGNTSQMTSLPMFWGNSHSLQTYSFLSLIRIFK